MNLNKKSIEQGILRDCLYYVRKYICLDVTKISDGYVNHISFPDFQSALFNDQKGQIRFIFQFAVLRWIVILSTVSSRTEYGNYLEDEHVFQRASNVRARMELLIIKLFRYA